MQKQQQTKTNLIRFRVTPDEKKNIQQAAAKAGLNVSAYLRGSGEMSDYLSSVFTDNFKSDEKYGLINFEKQFGIDNIVYHLGGIESYRTFLKKLGFHRNTISKRISAFVKNSVKN